jgi:hypothetical protein
MSGDGNVYTDSTFQHLYSGPGGYSITLTIRTDSGCIAERSLGSQVRIHPNPIAAFTVSPLEVSLLDPEVVVEDHAQDAVEWSYVVEGITIDEPLFRSRVHGWRSTDDHADRRFTVRVHGFNISYRHGK